MAGLFNLKSIFTADTKDLKKGAAEAKQAVKDFDDATTSALSELTGLFGASMGEINKALSTLGGGFLTLKGAITKATETTTLFSKALNVLKVAIVSTGIGALLVALGSLVAYFTKTQRGADKLAVLMGQVGQAFHEVTNFAIKFGEKIVSFFEKVANKVAIIKEAFKVGGGNASLIGPEESSSLSVFEKRKQLTKEQQQYEKDRIAFITREAELELEIEKQKEIAADKANKSYAERLAANKRAQELLNQLANERTVLAKKALELLQKDNSLSESKNEDLEAEANLKVEILNIAKSLASQNKELLTQQAELTTQATKQREEQERIAALKARKASELTLQKMDSSALLDQKVTSPVITPTIDTSGVKEGTEEVKEEFEGFSTILTDFSNTLSDAFASMIEGLVSGSLNMKDIFSTVLQFLAENLKAIGKALIAYGMAMEGFKKAFNDPYVAIAAGAALVAAGAVLSGLVKNMFSGGSSASASYATATSVGAGGTLDLTSQTQWQQKSQEVKVTGTIKASGRELAVVLENENKRKNYTT